MPDEVGPPLRLRTAPHQAPALGLGLVASSTYGQLGSNSAKLLPATVLRRGWRFFLGSSDAAPGRRNPKRHDLSNKCTLEQMGITMHHDSGLYVALTRLWSPRCRLPGRRARLGGWQAVRARRRVGSCHDETSIQRNQAQTRGETSVQGNVRSKRPNLSPRVEKK